MSVRSGCGRGLLSDRDASSRSPPHPGSPARPCCFMASGSSVLGAGHPDVAGAFGIPRPGAHRPEVEGLVVLDASRRPLRGRRETRAPVPSPMARTTIFDCAGCMMCSLREATEVSSRPTRRQPLGGSPEVDVDGPGPLVARGSDRRDLDPHETRRSPTGAAVARRCRSRATSWPARAAASRRWRCRTPPSSRCSRSAAAGPRRRPRRRCGS